MWLKVKPLIFFTTAVTLLFAAGCGGNNWYPSVSGICETWFEIKKCLVSPDNSLQGKLNSQAQVDDLLFTIDRFSASPVAYLYKTHRPGEMDSLKAIIPAANSLKVSIQNNDREGIFSFVLEIDGAINALQRIDVSLSQTSQLHYFILFFFFSLLVISSILVLWAFKGRLEKAEIREQQSLAFSRETIIAQERERSRIARELHDTVAQDLWRLSFQTESIDKAVENGQRSRLCAEVVKGQKELMQRVRNICDNLIPPDFQRRRLDDALRNLCYNFEQRTGIECQGVIQDKLLPGALDSDTQLQCFRIVQECLSNIEKHSGATEISVLVHSGKDDCLVICVSDNGKGFSLPEIKFPVTEDSRRKLRADGHFGLWGIYERAASISAAVTLDSGAGEGTMVTLQIPFNMRETS